MNSSSKFKIAFLIPTLLALAACEKDQPVTPTPPAPPYVCAAVGDAQKAICTHSGTFVVPEGVTSITIDAVAGDGGDGHSCYSRDDTGTSGSKSVQTFAVTQGEILTYSFGYGGGGGCDGGDGGSGSDVVVTGTGVTMKVIGGSGGRGAHDADINPGNGYYYCNEHASRECAHDGYSGSLSFSWRL